MLTIKVVSEFMDFTSERNPYTYTVIISEYQTGSTE